MLQGFGGSVSAEAATKKSAAKAKATSNPWRCEDDVDGLGGKYFGCNTRATDGEYDYYLSMSCDDKKNISLNRQD